MIKSILVFFIVCCIVDLSSSVPIRQITEWSTVSSENSTAIPRTGFPSTEPSEPTTAGPKPFSVRLVTSNVPSEQYIIDAIGILQLYLEEDNDFDVAVNRFLSTFKKKHDTQIWKLSSGCKILTLPNDTTYIKLRETYTNTEVNLFV
ncbi:uncharacterized protein LOC126738516 [Anthonomus grandis grandis]|uniref:uncharacterized protein LOC126738516 n=1 Tax=Anthonomus grandis grandis TaxID=2921223 RepID=UPI00216664CD|nr:uncharacterized protein LOC126738516 [Anthonomus grandis grandis]